MYWLPCSNELAGISNRQVTRDEKQNLSVQYVWSGHTLLSSSLRVEAEARGRTINAAGPLLELGEWVLSFKKAASATMIIAVFPIELKTKIRYLKICCYYIILYIKIILFGAVGPCVGVCGCAIPHWLPEVSEYDFTLQTDDQNYDINAFFTIDFWMTRGRWAKRTFREYL